MDPITCCLLGICCPPESVEQEDAFLAVLTDHFTGDAEKAKKVVEKMKDDLIHFSKKLAKACEDA